jgi:phage/plasmid primase-like uncharacterized protein
MDWLKMKAPADIVIDVHISIKDSAKVLGAKWSPDRKTWYIPKGEKIGYFIEFLPADGALRLLYDTAIYVSFDENETARELGAGWNWEIKRWVLPEGTDIRSVPARYFEEGNDRKNPRRSFAEVADELGLIIKHTVADGKIQRAPITDDKQGKKSGAYVIFEDINGRAGYVQNFKTGQKVKFYEGANNGNIISDEHRLERISKARAARDDEIKQLQDNTAKKMMGIIKRHKPASASHKYLQSKKIEAHGVLQDEKGRLVVVMQDVSGEVRSCQYIHGDGTKTYVYGGQKKECFHLITGSDRRILFLSDLEPLVICEGFATGASIHEGTGYTVACAMDCGNILSVAMAFRREYGDGFQIIIAGDDDHRVKDNPGRRFATEAAKTVNGIAVFPLFTDEEKQQNLTDFNDLAQSRSNAAVIKEQLRQQAVTTDK